MHTGNTETAFVTRIALVRHGEATSNASRHIGGHSDAPLTEQGHRQAKAVAAAIAKHFQPTTIVTSDLIRAHQTAEPIATATGLDLQPDQRWRERSLGILDGLHIDEVERKHPTLWKQLRQGDPTVCPPQAEAVDTVYTRIGEGLDAVLSEYRGGRIVVVSHGLAIFHALAHILGLGSPAGGLKVFAIVGNASLSTFRHTEAHWYIERINDCAHLPQASA